MDKVGWRSWQEMCCTQHLAVLGQSQVWFRCESKSVRRVCTNPGWEVKVSSHTDSGRV